MARASARSWTRCSVVDLREVYRSQAEAYAHFVAHEDYTGHLLPALNRIRPLDALDVLELGAGTGRLTRLVMPLARSILALDVSTAMLEIARTSLRLSGEHNWYIAAADHRWLPVRDHAADVVLAGWTIGQHVAWNPGTWQADVEIILAEVRAAQLDVPLLLGGSATPDNLAQVKSLCDGVIVSTAFKRIGGWTRESLGADWDGTRIRAFMDAVQRG